MVMPAETWQSTVERDRPHRDGDRVCVSRSRAGRRTVGAAYVSKINELSCGGFTPLTADKTKAAEKGGFFVVWQPEGIIREPMRLSALIPRKISITSHRALGLARC